MSYLGFPRITFAGTFQADIATTNNRPQYFDNKLFEPRYQWRMNPPDVFGLWHPKGPNAIRLTDVGITAVHTEDGTVLTAPADDPLIGGAFADDNLRVNGKMVDLDPSNQTVPEIYGMRPRLLTADGTELLRGDYLPAGMADVWGRATMPSGRPDAAACYQSVLTNPQWAEPLNSPALRALRALTEDDMLSIKFTLDAVEDGIEHWPDNITFGRLVGSIGPYRRGEPKRFVAARRLAPATKTSPMNFAPMRVDAPSSKVFLDFGNSIKAQGRGGPLVDVGELRIASLDAQGKPTPLAVIPGIDKDFLTRDAAIAAVPLSAEALATAGQNRLAVIDASGAVLLNENADASMLRADEFVFRLAAGTKADTATATLYATRFGQPLPSARIVLGDKSKPAFLQVPDSVTTDQQGMARVTLLGTDPDNPRGSIDGMIYACPYGFAPGQPAGTLSARVYDAYTVPQRPTWFRDVQPLMQQYANLYPIMRDHMDLANYNHMIDNRAYLRRTLLADIASPNHMPVTRDLSPGKRDMIVRWLDTKPAPPLMEINDVEQLRTALQTAVLIEQAVMPPYLAALVSIKPGANTAIAGLLRGVVSEEMQHMAQMCNILNAIGGTPQIGRPGLVPTYPGSLPGPVLPDLRVRLRKLSLEHVKDVFMAIEAPQYPTVDGKTHYGAVIDPKSVQVDRLGRVTRADPDAIAKLTEWFAKAEYPPQTIGWFYNCIATAMISLQRKGKLFTGDPRKQVGWPDAPGTLYQVRDLGSALLGIYQVIEQGEGSPHDLNGDRIAESGELSHYYRFAEIVNGRQLILNSQNQWVYEGDEIPFDPDGVYPVLDDADTYLQPPDSVGRRESMRCDTSYTNLLTGLNRVFNGHPAELDDTVGLMYQLQSDAKRLLTIASTTGAGTVLGPAFQSPGIA